jgi:hypothetical protein
MAVMFVLSVAGTSARAEIEGKYEKKYKSDGGESCSITVTLSYDEDDKLGLSGGASSMAVAPDFGVSSLREKDGTYWGIFEDSFGNRGVLSVKEEKNGLRLWMFVTAMEEPRPTGFYGEHFLKRVK